MMRTDAEEETGRGGLSNYLHAAPVLRTSVMPPGTPNASTTVKVPSPPGKKPPKAWAGRAPGPTALSKWTVTNTRYSPEGPSRRETKLTRLAAQKRPVLTVQPTAKGKIPGAVVKAPPLAKKAQAAAQLGPDAEAESVNGPGFILPLLAAAAAALLLI